MSALATNPQETQPNSPSLILITGISGAGRRATAAALEELGWYVADNLPPELIVRMVQLTFTDESPIEKLAIVTDVRSRDFAGNLSEVLLALDDEGRRPTILFLDASDEALIQRFDAVRRTHPLQGQGTLQDGLDREREMLQDIRERADIVLDTTDRSVHDLRRELEGFFSSTGAEAVRINIQSFGFKNGAPKDADMLFDARFLPNPYWVPELREFRGCDEPVYDYIMGYAEARDFVNHVEALLVPLIPGYRREGKTFVTVGIGCTGGHHRSVAISLALEQRLKSHGLNVALSHRDLEK